MARGALAAGVGETRPAPRFRAAKAARSQLEAGNYALSGLGVVGGGRCSRGVAPGCRMAPRWGAGAGVVGWRVRGRIFFYPPEEAARLGTNKKR